MVAFATDELEMRLDSSAAAGTRLAVESPCSPQIPPSWRRAVAIVATFVLDDGAVVRSPLAE